MNIIPKDLKIGKLVRGAEPIRPVKKSYQDRLLLCGDASGFINPLIGDGIDYSMSSGKIAANVSAKALESNDTQGKFLSKYKKLCKNDFGKDIAILLRPQDQWGEKTEKFIRLVNKDKKICDTVLEIITGNLRLHKHQWKLVRRVLYLYVKDKLLRT